MESDVDHGIDCTFNWVCHWHWPNIFNELGGFVSLCGSKGKSYINGNQWLKSQAYLKWVVASRVVNSFVVVVWHIRKVVIQCAWMFGVVHLQYMHDHICLAIGLRMEGSGFGELGVQQ